MNEGAAGPIPTPGHWARVQLAQGNSAAGLWDLSSETPEARITVGAGFGAGWSVQAPDVAPVHFELFWDGSALWISPPFDGDLTVDGERIQGWRQMLGRSRVEFGRAAFLVETSHTIAMRSTGESLIPKQGTEESTQTSGMPPVPRNGADGDEAFADSPTTAFSPEESLPPLEGDSTRMVDGGAGLAAPKPSFGSAGRPMLGSSEMPSPGMTPIGTVAPLKTQVFDAEAAGLQLDSSPPPPPSSAMPPLGGQRKVATDVISSRVATGGFAMPPVDPEEQKSKLELPPRRTLILAGVTLVVALIFLVGTLVVEQRQEEAVARQQRLQSVSTQESRSEALRNRVRQEASARIARREEREAAWKSAASGDIESAVTAAHAQAEAEAKERAPSATEEEPVDVEAIKATKARFAVQELAVKALERNDHAGAMAFYLWLGERYPEVDAYGEMIRVLREMTQ